MPIRSFYPQVQFDSCFEVIKSADEFTRGFTAQPEPSLRETEG